MASSQAQTKPRRKAAAPSTPTRARARAQKRAPGRQPPRLGRVVFLIAAFVLLAWLGMEIASLPSSEALKALNHQFPEQTALMRARQRKAEREGRRFELDYRPVAGDRLAPSLSAALVASEDARFFRHDGVDWQAMKRALRESAQRGTRLRGASTLTQQLAKNFYLSERRSPIRKLKEAWIARRMERVIPKTRLLELYLNCVEWGDGLFGAEAAARVWFGKGAAALDLAESAALIAMLPNPHHIGPVDFDAWRKRTERVLRRLESEGLAKRADLDRARGRLDALFGALPR